MKRSILIFFLLSTFILLNSCQKDVDLVVPNGTTIGADTNWVATISASSPVSELKHALNRDFFTDSIDCSTGGTINTQEGLTLILPPQSLQLSNGLPAAGKIYAESMLINQRGDMVKMDRPTTSNNRLLTSGGEIFVKLRKDAEELHLAPGKRIYLKYADPSPSTGMRIFYGDENNPDRFNWLPNQDSAGINTSIQGGFTGYELSSGNLRWINCDRFTDTSGTRVNIVASLPIDYTNANTVVYLVFHDIKSVMNMYGDAATKKFSSPKIPSGKAITLVSITKKSSNSYYLGYENVISGQTGTTSGQIVPLTPHPTSLPDIRVYLSTL